MLSASYITSDPPGRYESLLRAVGASLPGLLAVGYFHHTWMPDSFGLSGEGGAFGFFWREIYFHWRLLGFVPLALQSLLMTLSMAPPLLLRPVGVLWWTTAPRERICMILCFTAAYVGVWFPAGVLLRLAALLLQWIFGGERTAALLVSFLLAIAWNTSPARHHCLAVCTTTGSAKTIGCSQEGLRMGAHQGFFCIGTCWFLMLVPLLGGNLHLLLMAVVMLILSLERNSDTLSSVRQFINGSDHRQRNPK